MTTILLQTKLQVPPAQPGMVMRTRLYDELGRGVAGKLIVIAAPAGSGKSTLVAEWLRSKASPAAWISLDESDNEPHRFAAYLLAAFDSTCTDIGEPLQLLLEQPQPPPLLSLISLLINQLTEWSEPSLLIFDDYHLITEPSIHNALDFLLEHLPANLTLIFLSRTEPPLQLARLRARNQLAQLSAADLRFTQEEITDFLAHRMGLVLADESVKSLAKRTEGWAAGLQFAALGLQKLSEPDAIDDFIFSLSGRNRHTAEYLLQEVLRCQPPDIQEFLLQTSILPRLQAELCATVLNISNTDQVQCQLEVIENEQLFLMPLDDKREWYRYHHLFAELCAVQLQRTFSADEIKKLHQRASLWFEHAESMDEAIDHALAAEDFARAAKLIELVLPETLWAQNSLNRIRRWLSAFPEYLLPDFPKLVVTGAFVFMIAQDGTGMKTFMAALEQIPKLPGEVSGDVAFIRSVLLREQGKIPEATDLIEEALAAQSNVANPYTYSLLLLQRVDLYDRIEDLDAMERLFHQVCDLTYRSRNHSFHAETTMMLGHVYESRANLSRAEAFFRDGLALAHQYGGPFYPPAGRAHLALGSLCYERNDFEQALLHLEQGIEIGTRTGTANYLWLGHKNRAHLFYAQGRIGDGNLEIQTLKTFIQTTVHADFELDPLDSFAAEEMELALRRKDLEPVARWIEAQGLTIDLLPTTIRGRHWLVADYLIMQSEQLGDPTHLPLVVRLLQHVIDLADNRRYIEPAIRLRVMLAQAHHGLGDSERAMATLEQALDQAKPSGYIRTFIDRGATIERLLRRLLRQDTLSESLINYVSLLLATFDNDKKTIQITQSSQPLPTPSVQVAYCSDATPNQSLIEPLTEREQEVLSLLVNGLSNQEIADQLIISQATVKRHVYNIYGKLGVRHRGQAIAQARELSLV